MTDRKTASTINDTELDQLYDDLDRAQAECRAWAEAESADIAAGSYARRVEELQAELAALRQVARGYCPACGRGDAAPTVTDWEEQRDKAGRLEIANRALNTAAVEAVERAEQAEHRLRLAHQARRAKEQQLDGIRRALCEVGAMQDDDPYSHADLEDVIQQAFQPPAPAPSAATQATGHHYLSTGCLHDQHDYCSNVNGIAGLKKPAQCKFCAAPCQCPCHREK